MTDTIKADVAIAKKPRHERLSRALARIAREAEGERITLGDLLAALRERAYGAMILVFAFPNMLPSPPGLAAVLGLPLVVLSALLMTGHAPWLPRFIARRGLTTATFRTMVDRAIPWIKRAERLLRHRLLPLTGGLGQRAIGALCLILALVLMLPVPFGNLMPALAISVLSLGLLERDGFWVLSGVVVAAAAFLWVGALAYALVKSTLFLMLNAF
ncbi:MAG: exopolysaccharide biosynthesis protein [Gemmobacter sp.]